MKLYYADCMDILKGIPEGSIDMILCDLPYGTTRNKWDVIIPHSLSLTTPYIPIAKTRGFTAQYDKTATSRIKEAQDNGKHGDQKKQPDHD